MGSSPAWDERQCETPALCAGTWGPSAADMLMVADGSGL